MNSFHYGELFLSTFVGLQKKAILEWYNQRFEMSIVALDELAQVSNQRKRMKERPKEDKKGVRRKERTKERKPMIQLNKNAQNIEEVGRHLV